MILLYSCLTSTSVNQMSSIGLPAALEPSTTLLDRLFMVIACLLQEIHRQHHYLLLSY